MAALETKAGLSSFICPWEMHLKHAFDF